MTDAQALPLDLPDPEPAQSCWYCGAVGGPFQTEHQQPISRGGRHGATVTSCGRCNALKGPLDIEEFRLGLAERLGIDVAGVVFAGEATDLRPATRIAGIRSLAADRSVTRIDPAVGEELDRAWRYLRATGDSRLSRKELASEGIAAHLDVLRENLGLGEEWPEANLSLFELDRPARTGRNQLAQSARVPMDRQHTKVPGELLDHARAGVEYRRSHGEPDLTLLDWIAEALGAQLAADTERLPGYPSLEEALSRRYGSEEAKR